jgi:hypothetical protein
LPAGRTTLAGLASLLLETLEQAQYLIPAAVSLMYGEILATAITLFAVPLLTLVFVDARHLFGKNADARHGTNRAIVSTEP